jgi:hypothetical protein
MFERNLDSAAWFGTLCALLAACAAGGGEPAIRDPMLQRWCDANPCHWDVSGEIKRVGSWHPNDYAIELVSDTASVSQLNAAVGAGAGRDAGDQGIDTVCFSFTMIADIDAAARVFVELDFFDDGLVDFSQRMPASAWEQRTFNITAPTWYQGVRFIVRKDGPGHVVLAQLHAQSSRACTAPPTPLAKLPDQASCEHSEQCSSGRCARGVCVSCGCDGGLCGDLDLDGGSCN